MPVIGTPDLITCRIFFGNIISKDRLLESLCKSNQFSLQVTKQCYSRCICRKFSNGLNFTQKMPLYYSILVILF